MIQQLSISMCCAGCAFYVLAAGAEAAGSADLSYPIVDTGQALCWNSDGGVIDCPATGNDYCGQDAQHVGFQSSYVDNGDGTVTDQVTGLMWQQTPPPKMTWQEAVAGAESVIVGGYSDWRLPTIKELYSLIDFTGVTAFSAAYSKPYIDTEYFDFQYGDESAGERFIDAQYWSSTEYLSTTMHGDPTVFGVNFADGRIKGYPKQMPDGTIKRLFVRYVRGNPDYGENQLSDNGDGTVTDHATALMWSQQDSGEGMDWRSALRWVDARNSERYLGYSDWRLPNAKELQSIVDYWRAPGVTGTPAIDPVFATTEIDDGEYPFYWTSTTHLDGADPGSYAVYIAFGRALGWMESPPGSGNYELLDVHGAGAQRSDPKSGDAADFPYGHGPQGDVIRIDNHIRLLRDADDLSTPDGPEPPPTALW